ETVEAIDAGDPDMLIEELGDLLLQVMLHAQIGQDAEEFDLIDVANGISDKLVFRHPHVFGTEKVETSEQVLANWDSLKAAEKAEKGLEAPKSRLGQVPPMAALAYAEKVVGRAAKAGFDWPDLAGSRAKVAEEFAELNEAIADGDPDAIFHELGDLLYALTNLARKLQQDPEDALRQAVRRFIGRFERMEELVENRGQNWDALTLEERKGLWAEAKRLETVS
ncbi:MAG TPA: nucleoside triphosphate pyrophosphohydrolase, partial [Oscillatoriaceae cyanobacterium]